MTADSFVEWYLLSIKWNVCYVFYNIFYCTARHEEPELTFSIRWYFSYAEFESDSCSLNTKKKNMSNDFFSVVWYNQRFVYDFKVKGSVVTTTVNHRKSYLVGLKFAMKKEISETWCSLETHWLWESKKATKIWFKPSQYVSAEKC